MRIIAYRFGRMEIDGAVYSRDLIVMPSAIHSPWRRTRGHSLSMDDLTPILSSPPELVIIGTGMMGRMHVPPEIIQSLEKLNVHCLIASTGRAVREFSKAESCGIQCAGAFHLTC